MSTANGREDSRAIRIVIVGGGRIGQVHARNILNHADGLTLTAIVEPYPSEALTSLAARAGIPVVPETGTLLADADAVIIALPTDLHEDVLMAAAAAGAHVLCEKPLAGDLDVARRMIDAAEKAGIVLQVGFNRRFDHNYRALRAAATNGDIGRIEIVRVTSRDPGPPGIDYIRQSGGLFMDMTIHDIDMIRFLTGDEVESVFARGACLVDEGIGRAGDIDTALVTGRFRGGTLGLVLDMGHHLFGGGYPEAAIDLFWDRIIHVHYKDCSEDIAAKSREQGWDYFESLRHGVFCELGQGAVDFPAITERLRGHGFDGWIVVEQDVLPGMGSPKECARRNRDYLASLGL